MDCGGPTTIRPTRTSTAHRAALLHVWMVALILAEMAGFAVLLAGFVKAQIV